MLSGEIARRYGSAGLPEGTIRHVVASHQAQRDPSEAARLM